MICNNNFTIFVTKEIYKMANEFKNGRLSLLYIDTTTPITTDLDEVTTTNAVAVACLTTNGFEGTTSAISATSKCSGGFAESVDGEKSWTMSADGLVIDLDSGDTRKNYTDLFKLWRSGTPFWAFIMDATSPASSPAILYGVARIDSFSRSDPDNDAMTFTISLTGIGEPGDQDDLAPST